MKRVIEILRAVQREIGELDRDIAWLGEEGEVGGLHADVAFFVRDRFAEEEAGVVAGAGGGGRDGAG